MNGTCAMNSANSSSKSKEEFQGKYPSILNDVIGPVMRGPSSSHCAAALRIGRIARDLMAGWITEVVVEYDVNGSLATTHLSQGSDMGLMGGLLGWDTTDERLAHSGQALADAGIKISFEIRDIGAAHPNTYRLILKNPTETHTLSAISTGGGMIEVLKIDGAEVSIAGDYYETLIYCDHNNHRMVEDVKNCIEADAILSLDMTDGHLIEIKAQKFLEEPAIAGLNTRHGLKAFRLLSPVLSVLSRQRIEVPFITCDEMLAYNQGKDLQLWELACLYEGARGSLSL
jgi:L-serine dehydratase